MEGGRKGERNTGGEGKGVREGQGKREEWIDGYTCTYTCRCLHLPCLYN